MKTRSMPEQAAVSTPQPRGRPPKSQAKNTVQQTPVNGKKDPVPETPAETGSRRGRGRPPKITNSTPAPTEVVHDTADVETKPSEKRGRGRPRKTPAVDTDQHHETEVQAGDQVSEALAATADAEEHDTKSEKKPKPKRGPGRPPKRRWARKDGEADGNHGNPEDTIKVFDPSAEASTSNVPTQVDHAVSTDKNLVNDTPAQLKRRGRPRKQAVSEPVQTNPEPALSGPEVEDEDVLVDENDEEIEGLGHDIETDDNVELEDGDMANPTPTRKKKGIARPIKRAAPEAAGKKRAAPMDDFIADDRKAESEDDNTKHTSPKKRKAASAEPGTAAAGRMVGNPSRRSQTAAVRGVKRAAPDVDLGDAISEEDDDNAAKKTKKQAVVASPKKRTRGNVPEPEIPAVPKKLRRLAPKPAVPKAKQASELTGKSVEPETEHSAAGASEAEAQANTSLGNIIDQLHEAGPKGEGSRQAEGNGNGSAKLSKMAQDDSALDPELHETVE